MNSYYYDEAYYGEAKSNVFASLKFWGPFLLIWMGVLCFVPDARPLNAPEWAVESVRNLLDCSEAAARFLATVILRAVGFILLGLFLALACGKWSFKYALPLALIVAPVLAIASQWIHHQHFPINQQVYFSSIASITGVLIGFGIRKKPIAIALLMLFTGGLFIWGTSTGVSDDLYFSARATGLHLLENADEIPEGDEGFEALLQMAFLYAEDNSHGSDAAFPNKAAILALGVIVGEEKVADVAGRSVNLESKKAIEALRRKIRLRDRNDLARHFWVSAALTVLSGRERSMAVGIAKELMDATPGGSGFSFVDLTADKAGSSFAARAVKNQASARQVQLEILEGARVDDFFPEIDGIPEGISEEDFRNEYGGLGGTKTNSIINDIRQRLSECQALNE